MSKVKYALNGSKRKLLRANRRYETKHKNDMRIKNVKNYAFQMGYWVKDSKFVKTKKLVAVPEQRVVEKYPTVHRVLARIPNKKRKYRAENMSVVGEKVTIIPSCVKKVYTYNDIPIKPRLIRSSQRRLKYIRNYANRRLRRVSGDDSFIRSAYKKYSEVWWEVW
jgi:hypothetical protein